MIDRIEIDGVVFETESPSVFSTGTWNNADGTAPGFGRGESLHSNGYFQYAATTAESGAFSLSNSVINVDEAAGVAVVRIVRTGGTATPATIEYRTVSGSAVQGGDYTEVDSVATFQPGQSFLDVSIPLVVDNVGEGTESFAFTIDNPSGAGLLVPRTATITINDIDLPNYTDFGSVAGLNLNGTAVRSGTNLRLTGTGVNTAGSAYYDTAIPVNDDTSFQSSFTFRISGGDGGGGADGLAFVLQNSPGGVNALGGTGGELGLEGINQSLAIEFDTYANAGDVNDNHVSVLINGNVTGAVATKSYGVDLNNGANKYAWVDYNGTNNVLAVYLSETNNKPGTPVIVTNVDLSALVGDQAYAGFSCWHRRIDEFSRHPQLVHEYRHPTDPQRSESRRNIGNANGCVRIGQSNVDRFFGGRDDYVCGRTTRDCSCLSKRHGLGHAARFP